MVNEAAAARIVAIEADRADSAGRVIDAHGSVVAPGFIDIQTHSDFTLPSSRGAPKVCSYNPWQRRT